MDVVVVVVVVVDDGLAQKASLRGKLNVQTCLSKSIQLSKQHLTNMLTDLIS